MKTLAIVAAVFVFIVASLPLTAQDYDVIGDNFRLLARIICIPLVEPALFTNQEPFVNNAG